MRELIVDLHRLLVRIESHLRLVSLAQAEASAALAAIRASQP